MLVRKRRINEAVRRRGLLTKKQIAQDTIKAMEDNGVILKTTRQIADVVKYILDNIYLQVGEYDDEIMWMEEDKTHFRLDGLRINEITFDEAFDRYNSDMLEKYADELTKVLQSVIRKIEVKCAIDADDEGIRIMTRLRNAQHKLMLYLSVKDPDGDSKIDNYDVYVNDTTLENTFRVKELLNI